jgi:hypothetical protein
MNIVTKTLKTLERAYESLIPDEETARRIGSQYVNRYRCKADRDVSY